jgi:DNA-directed RNA polymerase specialized sigma24 family protein
VSDHGAGRAIGAVRRIEAPRLIAGLTRLTRDVGVAEDLGQDALVAALEQWPASGVPANPGAWLMAIAKRRAIDRFRREELGARKRDEFGRLELMREEYAPGFDSSLDDDIGDDLLRLVFIACHPVLPRQARRRGYRQRARADALAGPREGRGRRRYRGSPFDAVVEGDRSMRFLAIRHRRRASRAKKRSTGA